MSLSARKHMRRIRGVLSSILSAVIVVALFQNCSDPVLTDPALSNASSIDAAFAYKASASHFAYMSCSTVPEPQNRNSHFSFRVGAYNTGYGLGLSSGFLSQTEGMNPEQRLTYIQGAENNQNVNLQLSVRSRYDLNEIVTTGGRNPVLAKDHDLIFPKLDSNSVAGSLVQSYTSAGSDPLRSIAGTSAFSGTRFEGSLRFFEGESTAVGTRSAIGASGNAFVTLGFVEDYGSGEYTPRSPGEKTRMYGKGFAPNFSSAFFVTQNSFDRAYDANAGIKILSGLTEVDLESGSHTSSQWECPDSSRFMIIRYIDVQTSLTPGVFTCAMNEDSPSDANLQKIRKVLPESDWYVDTQRRCIVEKAEATGQSLNACYGGLGANTSLVNYTGNVGPANGISGARGTGTSAQEIANRKKCGLVPGANGQLQQVSVTDGAVNKAVLCPQYVSICYRKNP